MTIAKNSKKAKKIIEAAHDIRCFSLSNSFCGKPMAEKPVVWGGPVVNNQFTQLVEVSQADFLTRELSGLHSKLVTFQDRYSIHVHSNLWYEFQSTQGN